MELEGRAALITGAARRVGRALALRLARPGVGLALHYRSSESEARQTAADCAARGARVELVRGDLADPAAPAELVGSVLAAFGRLDVLINSAAVFEPMTLDQFEPAAWDRALQVNLTAPVQLAQAARDALRAGGGCIINLLDAGLARPWPSHLAYMASKAGLEAMTRALARGLAPEVRVNALAPGVVEWPAHYPAAERERLTARIPLGRAGSPEDVAAAAEFLILQGDFITGAVLPIDGGRGLA